MGLTVRLGLVHDHDTDFAGVHVAQEHTNLRINVAREQVHIGVIQSEAVDNLSLLDRITQMIRLPQLREDGLFALGSQPLVSGKHVPPWPGAQGLHDCRWSEALDFRLLLPFVGYFDRGLPVTVGDDVIAV